MWAMVSFDVNPCFEALTRLSMAEERVRLGVLGAARIVPKALRAALAGQAAVTVEGLAARDFERAERTVQELGIRRAYRSYAELCGDPEIDAVYIALPVSEHAKHCEMALRAGKHVLCEKPFAMDESEAQHVLRLAQEHRRLVMEAHHWRYHSLLPEVARLIGKLGELSFVSASFEAGVGRPADIRRNPRLGPGVTMDFGCYAVQWVAWAVACGARSTQTVLDPSVEVARCSMFQEVPGVDEVVKAHLTVGSVAADIFCDMRPDTPYRSQLTVEGELGLVHFENPLLVESAWAEFEPNLQGIARGLGAERVLAEAGAKTTYAAQLDALFLALKEGAAPATAGRSILETQRVLDRLYTSAGLPSRRALASTVG